VPLQEIAAELDGLALPRLPEEARPADPKRRAKKLPALAGSKICQYLILYRVAPKIVRIISILNASEDWTRFFREAP
jgi:hypothetical protein